jgi:hypothetical protein
MKPEDLDIRDSMVFEKANPANRKTVREVADVFWSVDPPIPHDSGQSSESAWKDLNRMRRI